MGIIKVLSRASRGGLHLDDVSWVYTTYRDSISLWTLKSLTISGERYSFVRYERKTAG